MRVCLLKSLPAIVHRIASPLGQAVMMWSIVSLFPQCSQFGALSWPNLARVAPSTVEYPLMHWFQITWSLLLSSLFAFERHLASPMKVAVSCLAWHLIAAIADCKGIWARPLPAFTALFATWSACSLPSNPQCAGTQTILFCTPSTRRFQISLPVSQSCFVGPLLRLSTADRESVKMVIDFPGWFTAFSLSATAIAHISVLYDEQRIPTPSLSSLHPCAE